MVYKPAPPSDLQRGLQSGLGIRLQSGVQTGLQSGLQSVLENCVESGTETGADSGLQRELQSDRVVYNLVHKHGWPIWTCCGGCTTKMHRHTLTTHPAGAKLTVELMCNLYTFVHAWRGSIHWWTSWYSSANNFDCGVHGCVLAQCHRFRPFTV